MPAIVKLSPLQVLEDVAVWVTVDASTSMRPLAQATRAAVNGYIATLQSGTAVRYGMSVFSHIVRRVVSATPVDSVAPLAVDAYMPDGRTALYDAVGDAIDAIDSLDVPPAFPVVAIFSDGDDNASGHTAAQIAERIAACMARGWRFVFFAATSEATKAAARLGIPASEIAQYAATGIGTSDAFGRLARSTQRLVDAVETKALPPATFLGA